MVTPGLEKLILEGGAMYKTFTCAVGGVTTIPVPNKTFIIITDFIWTPFYDENLYDPLFDQEIIELRSTKQMQLRSGKENASYIFRDALQINTFDNGGTIVRSVKLDPPNQIHTFLKFTDNVNVDISIMPDCDTNWVMDNFTPMPDNSGENQRPNGYGTAGFAGFNTARRLTIAAGTKYEPPGFVRNKLDVLPRSTGEFHTDYLAGFQLNNPVGLDNNECYPIVTFGFVQVSKVTDN